MPFVCWKDALRQKILIEKNTHFASCEDVINYLLFMFFPFYSVYLNITDSEIKLLEHSRCRFNAPMEAVTTSLNQLHIVTENVIMVLSPGLND